MVELNNISKIKGSSKKSKRIGRGFGSGKGGHTSTKGMKGQKARKGAKPKIWFEGGQTPLVRRLPFINGFKSQQKIKIMNIKLSDLEKFANKEGVVTIERVLEVSKEKFDYVKILGNGEIKSAFKVQGLWYSDKAKEKIEKAGGTIE